MDLRTPVKNGLRHCGHAIVSTVHDRLTAIDRMLQDILDQNTETAATQTALLQSGIHLVEKLAQVQEDVGQAQIRLAEQVREHCASNSEVQSVGAALERLRNEAAGTADLEALRQQWEQIAGVVSRQLDQIAENAAGRAEIQALSHQLDQIAQNTAGRAEIQVLLQEISKIRANAAEKADLQALAQKAEVAQDILQQNVHIAETQNALLQSGVHLANNLTHIQTEIQQLEARVVGQVRVHCAAKTDVETLAATVAGVRSDTAELRAQIEHLRQSAAQKSDWNAMQTHIQEIDRRLNVALGSSIDLLQSLSERVESVTGRIEGAHVTGNAILESGIEKMLSLGADMHSAAAHSLSVLEPVAYQTKSFLENQSVRQVCVETSDYLSTNPELGLMEFLYSYLPSRVVLDIGAHVGDVSAHLLKAGYEVYAFEPYVKSYKRLKKRLGAQAEFHPFNLALGSVTGEAPMYVVKDTSSDHKYEDPTVFHSLAQHGMPGDLHFTGSISVPIRRLADLHREGLVPADAGLVKIDTEGYDLEVVRGMDECRYPVVLVEFWDTQIPFASQGLLYTVETMASEMHQRGYLWYIAIYRVWGQNETAFFCNHDQAVPNSWGNIVFFRDYGVFSQAQQWCSAVLPRTYFKHAADTPKIAEKSERAALS